NRLDLTGEDIKFSFNYAWHVAQQVCSIIVYFLLATGYDSQRNSIFNESKRRLSVPERCMLIMQIGQFESEVDISRASAKLHLLIKRSVVQGGCLSRYGLSIE
ncbi:hypothetical protein Tsp_15204, partial [Trichinella spiralis]|uniref:hypothetical protein n=1 Tax=Trichinella spiralis TaxID=6334 RepID=UPI0001EFE2C1